MIKRTWLILGALLASSALAETVPPNNTDRLREGSTNLYFTNSRARAAVVPAGACAVDEFLTGNGSALSCKEGIPGPQGDPGTNGTNGLAATVAAGTTTTGAPGSNSGVVNSGTTSAAIFDFTIPRGNTGTAGTNGTNGADGAAATVSAGTTTTGSPGSNASVSNVGTSSAAVFNFTIPRGDKGDKGDTGDAGGGVTGITSPDGSIDVANGTTAPEIQLHFPVIIPATGSAGAPTLRFDNDTGAYSTGDGNISLTTNGNRILTLDQSTAEFFRPLTVTDVVYPAKAAHAFLAGPLTGTAPPAFRLIQAGDVPNSALTFPIQAPQGVSFLGTGFCFDGDTCLDSSGDGTMILSANSTRSATVTPGLFTVDNILAVGAGATVGGDLAVTGNISAANYPPPPPTGSANTLASFDSGGALATATGFSLNDAGGISAYHFKDFTSSFTMHSFEIAYEIPATTSGDLTSFNIDSHVDRNNTGEGLLNGSSGFQLSHRHEGSGELGYFNGANFNIQSGQNGGKINDLRGASVNVDVQDDGETFNTVVLALDMDGAIKAGTNNTTLLNIGSRNPFAGDFEFLNGGNANTGTVARNFRFINWGNDASVGDSFAAGLFFNSGAVAKNFAGMAVFANGDVGTAGQNNQSVGYEFNIQNGRTNYAAPTGFRFYNGSVVLDDNNTTGLDVNNQAESYRFIGAQITNNGNAREETKGLTVNLQGNARTGAGIDVNMSGNGTDDIGGVRVNVSNLTSTNSKVYSGNFQGGTFGVQSAFVPFSGVNVDIGNNISVNTQIPAGQPVSGTDIFQTFFQSNLQLSDTIAPGPFGLGVNGAAMVHQLAIDSGITLPSYRTMLLGASAPPQSTGGEVTEFINLELVGLRSFGGAILNPNRYGLIATDTLLGQPWCDGTTNCWTIFSDTDAENFLRGGLVLGGTTKHLGTNVKLRVEEGHTKYVQAVAPAATPDANAGTGATCTVSGTDTVGKIELVTGILPYSAGPQCAVSFNMAYDLAPTCIITARNDNAAMASLNVFSPDASTTQFTVDFVNPEVAATTYQWSFRCD